MEEDIVVLVRLTGEGEAWGLYLLEKRRARCLSGVLEGGCEEEGRSEMKLTVEYREMG
jgi:hypothetical protein